jgi:hypothetical protein
MPSSSQAAALRVATALAYVCGSLPELYEMLGDDGTDPSSPLARLVAAARSDQDVAAPLEAVHSAVQDAGDPAGVHGAAGTRGGESNGLEPLQIVHRCPLGRCTGRPESVLSDAPPVCSIDPDRRALRRERLL